MFSVSRMLCFDAYGGEDAFDPNGSNNFVTDNFIFEFIPEPSSLLLTVLGAVMLWAFVKRKGA